LISAVWSGGLAFDCRIDVRDRGFLLADGVFDTLLALNGTPFAGNRHLQRLVTQAAAIGISVDPTSIQDLWARVLAQAEGPVILRSTVSRGCTTRGLWPEAIGEPTIAVTANAWSPDLVGKPRRLITSSIRRNANSPTSTLKSLAYLDHVLAAREAQAQQADDALFLNTAGRVACTTIANIFVLTGDRLSTPPAADGVLEGITRALVLEDADSLGTTATEDQLTQADIFRADAVFLTNSVRLLQAVTALDGRALYGRAGPFVAALAGRLAARIRDECGYHLMPRKEPGAPA
jgi:branched-chain amino acid aminotransferase